MATLVVGAGLLGLVAGLFDAGMRRILGWIVGVNLALFGIGFLVCATSPAPTDGAWFTVQQMLGAGLCLLAACIVILSGTITGIIALGRHAGRRLG